MSSDALPESDCIPGAPHPRMTARLFGQDAAEAAFLQAFNAGRLHHGWLISGPQGVGKATLAWRIARFLLTAPVEDPAQGAGLFGDAPPQPASLDVSPDHPVCHRLRALSEPGMHLVRRGGQGSTDADRHKNLLDGKFSQDIRVPEIRALASFIHQSAADHGRRVVIVDAADEMNVAAANAILKMLEEPPARTTFLLIAHQPARLLPTIRSRCRDLRAAPLAPQDLSAALAQAGIDPGPHPDALAELASGSVGEAVRLITLDGLALYQELVGLLSGFPDLDRPRMLRLADQMAARGGADRFELFLHLADLALVRLARTGATGHPPGAAAPNEPETFMRLAPDSARARAWAAAAEEIGARMRHGRAVNLDPAALVLDMVLKLQRVARGVPA